MTKGKFIQLLQTLTKKEVKAFTAYLNGNYGAQTQLLIVYGYILKYAKDYHTEKLKKEVALKRYFLPKGITQVVLNNRLSNLNQYLLEFLLWEKMKRERERIEIKKMKLEILKERQLTNRFYRELNKGIKEFEQKNSRWQDLNLLYLHELNAYNSDGNQYKNNRLDATMRHLDHFYATFKLKYATELLSRNNVLSETNKVWLLDEIKAYAKANSSIGKSYLDLYYHIIQLLEKEKSETFLKLEKYLYHFQFEQQSERLMLLTILTSFLARSYRNGQLDAIRKLFELYDFGLKEKIMIANKKFPPIPFKNIVSIACILGKFDWAKTFVENWSDTLPTSFRTDNYYYAKGTIDFAEKNYLQCLANLQKVSLQNFYYSIGTRALTIRAHYELEHFSNAIYACDAYEKYLRTHKVANESFVVAGLNFIKLMRLFIKNTPSAKITQVLDKLVIVQSKKWFINKLAT